MWPVGAVSSTTILSCRLIDGAGEGAEHGDLLGARRAEVLGEQRETFLVEAPGVGEDFGAVAGGLGGGVDPLDPQAGRASGRRARR